MRVISVKKEQILLVVYIVIILAGVFAVYNKQTVPTFALPTDKKVILIDAGHGGWDPGKVGIDDTTLEKDINLEIAKKLQVLLEQSGSYVITTRLEDKALGDTKNLDMNGRKQLANSGKVDMMVSIHQNAYTDEDVSGSQVFFYNGSEDSKKLAESIQSEINESMNQPKKRKAEGSDDYYVLKQTTVPSVIVECGFLSNPQEAQNLKDEEYQDQMAWAMYKGIVEYFDQQ